VKEVIMSDKSDDVEDVTDDAEDEDEIEAMPADGLAKPKSPSIYRIEIQNGTVFAGTLNSFEEQFFLFPDGVSDEDKLKNIELWSSDQGWSFQANLLH
jgi:small nuclear ribonucleoprotein (snRNP)-like protein